MLPSTYLAQMNMSSEDIPQHPAMLLQRNNSVSAFMLAMNPQPSNFYNSATHSASTQLSFYLCIIIKINALLSMVRPYGLWSPAPFFSSFLSFSQPSIPVRAFPNSSVNHLSLLEDWAWPVGTCQPVLVDQKLLQQQNNWQNQEVTNLRSAAVYNSTISITLAHEDEGQRQQMCQK